MDLVFGLWADGGASPDHGGAAGGALGQPVVGPSGLVDILETGLGLGGPHRAQVVRIAAFQSTLESLKGDLFWSRSLSMNPWATARTVLAWRDELIGLGWRADAPWTGRRLADLAAASRTSTVLAPGLPDRFEAVLGALDGDGIAPPVARVRLIDRADLLPSPVRRVIGRLRALGCVVEEVATAPAADPGTSLGRLQRCMLDGTEPAPGADGTVTIATAASEPLAAEVLGQWFAGRGAGDVALVAQEGDTDLLDHGLTASGQPRAGRSRSSVHRGSLQLLLLAFKGAWAPFDPQALIELLVFPGSPVPSRAAWRLASALEQAPGRGGADWTAVWDAVAEAERARAEGGATELAKAETRLAGWRAWSEPEMADPRSACQSSRRSRSATG